jgi:hypothetical protein
MRQMACHPDLVLCSKTNGNQFLGSDKAGEAMICRLCSDVTEDAIPGQMPPYLRPGVHETVSEHSQRHDSQFSPRQPFLGF